MIHSFVFEQGKLVGQDLDLDALRLVRGDPGLHLWVDLDQPTEQEVKQVLEGVFSFHPLAIEDCVTVNELPKIEDYEDYIFLVLHAIEFSRQEQFKTTELNMFLGKEFLVTYHTGKIRGVNSIIDKLRHSIVTNVRGPDRLAYYIIDLLVDNYKPVIDELTKEIQEIEATLFEINPKDIIKLILNAKKELSDFRVIVAPQREVVSRLARGEFKLIRTHLLPYFRDITDNLSRYDATGLNYSDQLLLIMDVYLNKAQHETNQVIKALAIMTALTIPITVVSGWYGMNFRSMPEISMPFGYEMAGVFTIATTLLMVLWAKRRNWF
ncbi:MAG: magnesium/cobalt transporter CorA [Verrucomicrobiae bacterium]|nr:magnesium/cobalt transporter CorA [Verrucomicrobiae bacterium]